MSRCTVTLIVVWLAVFSSHTDRSTAAFQEDVPDPPPVVNVEFILDSSGSMANVTDTGETRMDAAKRVLRDVVNSLPEREGAVNVGFRIYGHEGDNTEATKDQSCQASNLQVPVQGVDRDALLSAIDVAQPTGWTPIARSLSRAGKDFPQASETSINAVVLVTDGTETCDGDPVKVARDLNRKDGVELITHVIGFGTTPEEQQVLSGIAENGQGLLLGAANATELRNALFSILEDLQIVVGAGFVGGNAFGLLPPGEPGELSVVGVGPLDVNFPNLAFVVRNNTGEDVVGIKANVTARDAAGTLLASADAQVTPFYVRAGGLALGSALFSQGTILPPDATFSFDLQQTPLSEARFSSQSDLDIIEASLFENRIVGTVQNGFTQPVSGGLFINVICFDQAGAVTGTNIGFSDSGQLAPEGTQTFEVDLFLLTYSGYTCPAFLVSAQGNGPVQLPPQPMPEVRTATGASRTATPAPSDSDADEATSANAATPAPAAENETEFVCGPVETSEDVVLALASLGLPIGDYAVYDASTDPNTRLGRPGQYISKVNFADASLSQQATEFPFEIINGGAVEIFSAEEDAIAWQASVEEANRTALSGTNIQYAYREGLIVLRLSGRLLPDQAAAYSEALAQIGECQ